MSADAAGRAPRASRSRGERATGVDDDLRRGRCVEPASRNRSGVRPRRSARRCRHGRERVALARGAARHLRKIRRLHVDRLEELALVEEHLCLPEDEIALWDEGRSEARSGSCVCASALKYISALRHSSRSTREIGASCTRSWRPKMTVRRRSHGRCTGVRPARSSARATRPGPARPAWRRRCAWRAVVSASSSTSVRVDLHALAERVDRRGVREDHARRVGLLSRRAAGAPHPEWLVLRLALDELRHDFLREEVPNGRVTEERRHVDQDRVEEERELLRVQLEMFQILGVAPDLQLV